MQMAKRWRGVRPSGRLSFSLQPHPLSSSGLLLFRIIQNSSEVLVCAALSEPSKCHFLCLEYSIHTLTHVCMCACTCVTNSHSSSGLNENLPTSPWSSSLLGCVQLQAGRDHVFQFHLQCQAPGKVPGAK